MPTVPHTGPYPNSPNWCWATHGYRIERIETSACPGSARMRKIRRIYSPAGDLVLDDAGHEGEDAYCKAHGLMTGEE